MFQTTVVSSNTSIPLLIPDLSVKQTKLISDPPADQLGSDCMFQQQIITKLRVQPTFLTFSGCLRRSVVFPCVLGSVCGINSAPLA